MSNSIRTPKEIITILIKILMFIIFFALIGVAFWSIIGLYGTRDYYGGNTSIHSTAYTIFGPTIGVIGMVFLLHNLARKRKSIRYLQVSFVIIAISATGLCLPYFTLPIQVRESAKQEFAQAWGNDWESQIYRPNEGPWLNQPYSLAVEYAGLPIDESTFTVDRDIEFLTLGPDTFKCDAYIPIKTGPFPVLIVIHGGGWLAGDKEPLEYQREYFAAAGFTVFTIQYGAHYGVHSGALAEAGISRQYSMQEIMNNIANFSNWLAKPETITEYKLDITKVFVTGYSAGGHLSSLVSTARFNVSDWNPNVILRGGVDFYGITDLRGWTMVDQNFFNITGLFNDTVLTDYTIVDPFSPITYVNTSLCDVSNVVPILILHGDVDTVVDISQGREFNAKCDARGIKCTFITIPKGEHVFEGRENYAGAQISIWAMERFFQLCLSEL